MKSQCVITPTVKGEKSKLYQDLENKCVNNKPLTNILYGIAISKTFKEKYCKSKDTLDRLGEPTIGIVDSVLDIQSLLNSEEKIRSYEKELGVYKKIPNKNDTLGTLNMYTSPNEIVQKVQKFNKEHDDAVATIIYKDNEYFIRVEPKNSENFNRYEEYEKRIKKFSKVQEFLNNLGLDISYNNNVSKFANFYNVDTLISFIKNQKYSYIKGEDGKIIKIKGVREIYNDNMVDWLLFLGNNLNSKKTTHFRNFINDSRFCKNGELTPLGYKIIRQLPLLFKNYIKNENKENDDNTVNSGYINLTEEEREVIKTFGKGNYEEGEAIVAGMVIPFILELNNLLLNNDKKVNKLIEDIQEINIATIEEGKTYTLPNQEIKEIMRDLNNRFHIDQKEVNSTINSIKELVDFLLIRKKKEYATLKNLKAKSAQSSFISKVESNIEAGKYAESIAKMMQDISNKLTFLTKFKNNTKETEEEQDENTNKPLKKIDIIKSINKKCTMINSAFDFIRSNKDIIDKLRSIKTLNTENVIIDNETLDKIVDEATKLSSRINDLEQEITKHTFNTVYDAFMVFWGPNDVREFEGVKYSLKQLLTVSMGDITTFDRWLNSFGQTSDPLLNIIYKIILDNRREANEEYSKYDFILREATDKLYRSDNDSKFMFTFDKEGLPTGFLKNHINWDKYYEEYNKYKNGLPKNLSLKEVQKKLTRWKSNNTSSTPLFSDSSQFKSIYNSILSQVYKDDIPEDLEYENVTFILPNEKYQDMSLIYNMSDAQREYYYTTIAIKAILSKGMPMANFDIFRAIQIQGTITDQINNSKSVRQFIKNRVEDIFSIKEDDTEYVADDLDDALEANDILIARSDSEGHLLKTVPILYSRKLKDKTRLSTNMSQALNAWMAAAISYHHINGILDLSLTMEEALKARKSGATSGNKRLIDIFKYKNEYYEATITEKNGNIKANSLLEDYYDRMLYGRKKNTTKSVNVFGVDVSFGKAADFASRYTSITGLSTNLFGAEANLLVGKLQMIIEAGAGEFFNFKDFAVAEAKYYKMLGALMVELNSNNKKSLLALLGNYFDVQDDYLEEAKKKGYEKKALARILSNPSYMFLYGSGEHSLHYQTMLAVLNHIKVRNKKTGLESTMLDIFSVRLSQSGNNGILEVNTDDYEIIKKDKDGNTTYENLTEDYLTKVKADIKLCNNTMHGAFGEMDKGTAHKIAFMRLVMNFRQWMPAHYARRFQGKFYHADTDTWRRGYYVSTFNFLKNIFTDKDLKFKIRSNWEMLSDTDKYNIKRTCTELTILAILTAEIASLGTYKDKKGNWAYRNLQYTLRRLRMETLASVPIGPSFVKNIIAILNSPAASIKSFEKASTLFNFTNLFKEVQGGNHRGENMYIHKLEKNVPLYDKIHNQLLSFSDEDYMFNTFDMSGSILSLVE